MKSPHTLNPSSKIAVVADIHGNLPALTAALTEARARGATHLITVGDFIGGPFPEETLALLLSWPGWIIRGNHEDYYLRRRRGLIPALQQTSLQMAPATWTYQRLTSLTLDYLAGLPDRCTLTLNSNPPLRLVHGSPRHIAEHTLPNENTTALQQFRAAGFLAPTEPPPPLAALIAEVPESVILCGHSHIAWQEECNGKRICNPGAAGASISGDWRTSYALLTPSDTPEAPWDIKLHTVPYDLDQITDAYRKSGYLNEGGAFARAYLRAIQTGRNIPGEFLRHVRRLMHETGRVLPPGSTFPDDLWQQAAASFDWHN